MNFKTCPYTTTHEQTHTNTYIQTTKTGCFGQWQYVSSLRKINLSLYAETIQWAHSKSGSARHLTSGLLSLNPYSSPHRKYDTHSADSDTGPEWLSNLTGVTELISSRAELALSYTKLLLKGPFRNKGFTGQSPEAFAMFMKDVDVWSCLGPLWQSWVSHRDQNAMESALRGSQPRLLYCWHVAVSSVWDQFKSSGSPGSHMGRKQWREA